MVAPIIAAEAAKRGIDAGKALTGDIYTRRWTSVVGKGKKKRVVEHEAHLNTLSAVILAAGAATTAALAGAALWATGKSFKRAASTTVVRRWVEDQKKGTVTVYSRSGVPMARNVPAPDFFADSPKYLLKQAEKRYNWTFETGKYYTESGKTTAWVACTTTDRGAWGLQDREGSNGVLDIIFDPLGLF